MHFRAQIRPSHRRAHFAAVFALIRLSTLYRDNRSLRVRDCPAQFDAMLTPEQAETALWKCPDLLLAPHVSGRTFMYIKGKEDFFLLSAAKILSFTAMASPLRAS